MVMLKKIAILGLSLAMALTARAGGLDALDNFVHSVHSGSADFTQVVTSVAKAGQSVHSKTSTGTFAFLRPNRFRFDYLKPFAQTIVADGQTLWLYDQDLNQVTARSQAQVLASTPAALIASAADLTALRGDFDLQDGGISDNDVQWVQALPKSKDGQLQSVRAGFRNNELVALEILDSFGQKSVLSFSNLKLNPALKPEQFQFKAPAGAEVIRP